MTEEQTVGYMLPGVHDINSSSQAGYDNDTHNHDVLHVFNIISFVTSLYLVFVTLDYSVSHLEHKRALRQCNYVLVAAALLLFAQSLLIELNMVMSHDAMLCMTVNGIQITISSLVRSLVFLGLWIRQHAIHGVDRITDATPEERSSALSRSVLVGIAVCSCLQIAVFAYVSATSVLADGKRCSSTEPDWAVVILSSVVILAWAILQLALLHLSTGPLRRQLEASRSRGAGADRGAKRLRLVILRLRVCAGVSTAADLIFVAVFQWFRHSGNLNYFYLCNNFVLIVHLCSMLCSFVDCRRRLFPMVTEGCCENRVEESHEATEEDAEEEEQQQGEEGDGAFTVTSNA